VQGGLHCGGWGGVGSHSACKGERGDCTGGVAETGAAPSRFHPHPSKIFTPFSPRRVSPTRPFLTRPPYFSLYLSLVCLISFCEGSFFLHIQSSLFFHPVCQPKPGTRAHPQHPPAHTPHTHSLSLSLSPCRTRGGVAVGARTHGGGGGRPPSGRPTTHTGARPHPPTHPLSLTCSPPLLLSPLAPLSSSLSLSLSLPLTGGRSRSSRPP
jgi:hypothetical protein